jgi:SM-20-related protein
MTGSTLNLDRLKSANVVQSPYPFAIVPGFVRSEARDPIDADFPRVEKPGSFPLRSLSFGPAFSSLIEDLTSSRMTALVSEKLDMDLSGRPIMVTVRGQCCGHDGQIHTDSVTKLVTMLLYMNSKDESERGRLRILRSATDLNDYAAEVPADEGTLLIFKNGPNAWHGFEPVDGMRRVIQVNWVTDRSVVRREEVRHRISAFFKRLGGFFSGGAGTHAAAH